MEKSKVLSGIVILVVMLIICLLGYYLYSNVSYGTKEGTIIDKQYNSAYFHTTTTTNYVNGSYIKIPQQQYISEYYTFKIQKNLNDKKKTVVINVTKEEFEMFCIGDYFKR